MSWWVEQVFVNTVVWASAGAATFTVLVRKRRERDAEDARIVRRAMDHDITLYQAAEFTQDSPTEVAVWLLLERGYVHVSRDGRVRAAIMAKPTPTDDPAQAAVYDLLKRNPHGLKLHEIKDDKKCHRVCERDSKLALAIPELATLHEDKLRGRAFLAAFLLPLAAAVSAAVAPVDYRSGAVRYWVLVTLAALFVLPVLASVLFPRSRAWEAQIPLYERCRRLLSTRFAELGHQDERDAVTLYRTKAPAYRPAHPPSARRRSWDTGCSTAYASCGSSSRGSSSSSTSSCSSSSCSSSSCGSSSCGGSSGGSSCGSSCGSS